MDCRVRRTQEWTIRCYHEAQMHERYCFLNPTFEHDPVSLSRRPFQIFFKNMRKAGLRFRYFGCGEYGEKLGRPHGHIILFGQDFRHDRYAWKPIKGRLYYRSPTLEKYWPHGHILFSDFEPGAAAYTAGYTTKKITGQLKDEINPDTGLRHYEKVIPETGEIVDVMPEFCMASNRPGIGHQWLKKNYREIYPTDSVVMNGREYRVPRKYDEWLKAIDEDLYDEVMQNRLEYLESQPQIDRLKLAREGKARDAKRKHYIPERS